MWKEAPVARKRQEIRLGPVSLTVESLAGRQNLQQFSLYLVRNSNDPIEQCLELWPTEALSLAHKALDAFEAHLKEHQA